MNPAFHAVIYKDNLGRVNVLFLKDCGIPDATKSQLLGMCAIAEMQLERGAPDFSGLDNSSEFVYDTGILLGSDDEYRVFVDMNLMTTLKNTFRRNPHVLEARAMLKDAIAQLHGVNTVVELYQMLHAKKTTAEVVEEEDSCES